jgi:hypothetical protein
MEKEASSSSNKDALRQPRLPKGLSKLHVHVMHAIRSKELLKPNDHILIAVSGGQVNLGPTFMQYVQQYPHYPYFSIKLQNNLYAAALFSCSMV